MIVRVLRFRVQRPRVAQFNAAMRRQLALLREQPGLAYVRVARRITANGGQEAVLFEEWRDAGSLYAWVGPHLSESRLVPGARELVDDLAVAHYELLSEEPDDAAEGGAVGSSRPAEEPEVSRG